MKRLPNNIIKALLNNECPKCRMIYLTYKKDNKCPKCKVELGKIANAKK